MVEIAGKGGFMKKGDHLRYRKEEGLAVKYVPKSKKFQVMGASTLMEDGSGVLKECSLNG